MPKRENVFKKGDRVRCTATGWHGTVQEVITRQWEGDFFWVIYDNGKSRIEKHFIVKEEVTP